MVMMFEELCKPLDQCDLSLLHKTIEDYLLKAKYEKTLTQTPGRLTDPKKGDQRWDKPFPRQTDDGESTEEDKGIVSARTRGKAGDIREK
jgi:hypothetical protein